MRRDSASQQYQRRWILRWLLNLGVAIGLGLFGIPFLRTNPPFIHEYVDSLNSWQRHLILLGFCVSLVSVLFKLLAPRLAHLKLICSYPPLWLAWLIGTVVVALIDLTVGLSKSLYQGTVADWLVYGVGSLVVVGVYRHWTGRLQNTRREVGSQCFQTSLDLAEWSVIESWLSSDATAEVDFLGHYAVSQRVMAMLENGIRSVGIVAPFGAGKSSIIDWMIGMADRENTSHGPRILISRHSCWRFEDSASSIHAMLADALKLVGQHIDTFHISSLPDTYRQSISSVGNWLDALSHLALGRRDPIEQFGSLSEMLSEMKARLVFIVEDLDRNESRSFDTQEVLAFLQQLKESRSLSFVLTGGLAATRRIDFAKLCDHIEYLKLVDVTLASTLVGKLRERSKDSAAFQHINASGPDDEHHWGRWSGLLLSDFREYSLPQATAALLNTPRSLRHAIARTNESWKSLHGEINWNHLFAVNVLRFAAPECFQFLLRRWARIRSVPSRAVDRDLVEVKKIRTAVLADWNKITQDVDWSPAAALAVMTFIIPAVDWWISDENNWHASSDSRQGVDVERYWRRAVSETCEVDEVRDQRVLQDSRQWVITPNVEAPLVRGICSTPEYCEVWGYFATSQLGGVQERVRLLNEHVLQRLGREHGASANRESQGFMDVWQTARFLEPHPANKEWIERCLDDAANFSLDLVNAIWHYYGAPGPNCLLLPKDCGSVRAHVLRNLSRAIKTAEELESLLALNRHWTLHQLVYDDGSGEKTDVGPASWGWLGPILLASLRNKIVVVAVEVARLLASHKNNAGFWATDKEILFGFFPENAAEVARLLQEIGPAIDDQECRDLVKAISENAESILES